MSILIKESAEGTMDVGDESSMHYKLINYHVDSNFILICGHFHRINVKLQFCPLDMRMKNSVVFQNTLFINSQTCCST